MRIGGDFATLGKGSVRQLGKFFKVIGEVNYFYVFVKYLF